MYRRAALRVLTTILFVLMSTSAMAAKRDQNALKKIDEAINQHYLNTEFEKAQSMLQGIITACGDQCSKPVLARAWMFIGVVRGSSLEDLPGAKKAFREALALDPKVKLDDALATPEVRKAFEEAGASGSGGASAGAAVELDGQDTAASGCTPTVSTVELQRPIPVSCPRDPDADSAKLLYKKFGSNKWESVKLKAKGDNFQGTIPCTATDILGDIEFYVRQVDKEGEALEGWGSKSAPRQLTIVAKTDEPAPAFPGQEAPEQCQAGEECPPGFPCAKQCAGETGKGWGAACAESCECADGYSCTNGTCETSSVCESDDQCGEGGSCMNGQCISGGSGKGGIPNEHRQWVGLSFALDIAWMSETQVCGVKKNNYKCYYKDGPQEGQDFPIPSDITDQGNGITGGFGLGSMRVLASYDYIFPEYSLGLGGRAGFAFRGGPPSFLPVEVEGRVSYWIAAGRMFRPYVFVGGGMAQVDAMMVVTVIRAETEEHVDLNAYKKMGQGFAAMGGGVVFDITPEIGAQANVNFQYMFPSSGLVIEPSLGAVYGF